MFTRPRKEKIRSRKPPLSVQEIAVFGMLGSIMFCSKIAMEWAPNIHLVGALTMTYTLAYRAKGLIPLYVFIMLEGVFSGFGMWWLPYLYIWAVLWGVTMLLPKDLPLNFSWIYPIVCAMHGLAFGTLYAPAQALMFGLNFEQTLAWIARGLPYDGIHAAGNFAAGMLVMPLTALLRKIDPNARGGKKRTKGQKQ